MSVLVVGAGPTGLMAALTLKSNGVDARIIDKRTVPSRSSRALGLQARSMELLAGLGIAERVTEGAHQLSGATVMRGHRRLVEMAWVPPESPYPYTYVVPQAGLEDILRSRLAEWGIEVERGVGLRDLERSDGTVVAQLDDGTAIEAEWLIGADGGRSRTREVVGVEFPQNETGETYQLADVRLALPIELGDSAMWLGPAGPLMLMRLPGGLWRVFADVTDRGVDASSELTASALEQLLEERGPRGTRVEAVDWTSVFRTRIGLADAYRAGRVFLAGDAAHVFPPFGGQGMNLGIQDAANLGWRLAGVLHGAPERLLNGYEQERRPVARATIADVETRRRLYALRHPIARWARDQLLRLGGSSRRAEKRASLQNSQLATTYRTVVADGDHGPAPRPGDRAPDGPVGDTTVHHQLGLDHVTVINFDPEGQHTESVEASGVRTLTVTGDDHRRLGSIYGVGPGERVSVLVRPDGHVAARSADRSGLSTLITAMIGVRP